MPPMFESEVQPKNILTAIMLAEYLVTAPRLMDQLGGARCLILGCRMFMVPGTYLVRCTSYLIPVTRCRPSAWHGIRCLFPDISTWTLADLAQAACSLVLGTWYLCYLVKSTLHLNAYQRVQGRGSRHLVPDTWRHAPSSCDLVP